MPNYAGNPVMAVIGTCAILYKDDTLATLTPWRVDIYRDGKLEDLQPYETEREARAFMQELIDYRRLGGPQGDIDLKHEQARLMKARADLAELRLSRMRAEQPTGPETR